MICDIGTARRARERLVQQEPTPLQVQNQPLRFLPV